MRKYFIAKQIPVRIQISKLKRKLCRNSKVKKMRKVRLDLHILKILILLWKKLSLKKYAVSVSNLKKCTLSIIILNWWRWLNKYTELINYITKENIETTNNQETFLSLNSQPSKIKQAGIEEQTPSFHLVKKLKNKHEALTK